MSSRVPPTENHNRPPRPIRRGAPPPAPTPSTWTNSKRIIWSGAFAAVTVFGAIYGAGLKTRQEYKAEKKKILETPPEERIRELEARRAVLMTQKRPLEKKLEELRLRVQQQGESPDATSSRS